MIFPVAECERTVQVGDKTRLLGVKSYVNKGEGRVTKVEICPDFVRPETSAPYELLTSGTITSDGYITSVPDDLSQVQFGMIVTGQDLDPASEVTVSSVDNDQRIIYLSGANVLTTDTQSPVQVRGTINTPYVPTFIDVTGQGERDWFLDWAYDGLSREVTIAVRITTETSEAMITRTLNVLSLADDILFSTDDDLQALEPGLTRYVPQGRATFLNVHREAKLKILESLSDEGIRTGDGTPLTASVLKNKDEVRTWSRDLTLSLIFQGMSNEASDVFQQKAKYYFDQAQGRADRAYLTLNVPVNGSDEPYRASQVQTVSLCR